MNDRRLIVPLLAAALLLAGCNGGTVDRHALTNDAATLDSIACEGALLAGDVARGRTTTYFAREQAEELRIQSSNFADALAKRKTVAVDRARESARRRRHAAVSPRSCSGCTTTRPTAVSAPMVERRLRELGSCS